VHFDAVSDFTARVRLNGSTVAIELEPLAAGRIDDSGAAPASATVYGTLGQWFALADSGSAESLDSKVSGSTRSGLWIKVEARPASQ
jgi:hypothetical protein